MSEHDWAGRVAVVTGGGSGIGRSMVRRFAGEAMSVVVADIDLPAAQAVAEELAADGLLADGAEALAVEVDVSSATAVEELAETCVERLGGVHLACNNAGVSAGGLSWELPMSDWEWVLEVNLWGVIHGVRSFVPRIVASGGGHVVNTASMAGLTSPPFMSPYSVAKHGVVALTEALYHELAISHPEVGASVLCPGWVSTRIHEAGRNRPERHGGPVDPNAEAGMREVIAGLIAAGADPDDVAASVWDAISERRFWVFTHDEWLPMAAEDSRLAFEGKNPVLRMPGGQ
ncbi:MAG: SDR family NAD(P)-dependent oxidoreductase [Microthrixaceae bacterium]